MRRANIKVYLMLKYEGLKSIYTKEMQYHKPTVWNQTTSKLYFNQRFNLSFWKLFQMSDGTWNLNWDGVMNKSRLFVNKIKCRKYILYSCYCSIHCLNQWLLAENTDFAVVS